MEFSYINNVSITIILIILDSTNHPKDSLAEVRRTSRRKEAAPPCLTNGQKPELRRLSAGEARRRARCVWQSVRWPLGDRLPGELQTNSGTFVKTKLSLRTAPAPTSTCLTSSSLGELDWLCLFMYLYLFWPPDERVRGATGGSGVPRTACRTPGHEVRRCLCVCL